MLNYSGVSCPYCNRKFTENDDVVVCPECGAPHHRECWEKENKCHFSVLHSEDFEWKKPFEEENAEKEQKKTVKCRFCGTENPENAVSCKNCKSPINIVSNDGAQRSAQEAFFASLTDPLGGVPKNEDFDGVTAEELGNFIGDRSQYFVRLFYFLKKKGSSVSFNMFAAMFNGLWFVSKKMYKFGALLCVLEMMFFSVKNAAIYYLYNRFGDEITTANLFTDIASLGASTALYATVLLQAAFMLLCGFFANRLYLKHCTKTIKSVQNSDNRSAVYAKKGGANMVTAVTLYMCYMVISYFSVPIIETILKFIK